ncbi:MAG TPA: hypothetical protein VF039_02095 [Longimicrobiales bacterium]
MTAFRIFAFLLVLGFAAAPAHAQSLDRELRVFFDCPDTSCDDDYLVEQIAWVDFVRDRADADVHILVTEQETGGGGEEYTLRFIGRAAFAGREHTLTHVLSADATDDDERRALARSARLGLAPFAAATPAAARLDVSASGAPADAPTPAADDPWNRWVFELGMDSWFEGEDRFSTEDLYGFASASRVTDDWRVSLGLNGQNNRETFEVDDSTTVESRRESYSANSLVTHSLSEHWSAGLWSGVSRSTRQNYDLSARIAPAIEYSIFPYSESTSRLVTVLYAVGPRYFDYAARTIFDRTHETTLHHFLALSYDATQPWGEIDALVDVTHIIAPIDGSDGWGEPQYSVSLNGGIDVRVLRGLSLRLDGGSALIRNQIHLAAGDLTEEEILTQQRELATDYRYWASFGFSYQFGSIYSPVVNRRLDYLN